MPVETGRELFDTIFDTSAIDKKIEKLSQEFSVIENLNREMILKFAQSEKRPDDYDKRHDAITKRYDEKFSKVQKFELKRTDQLNRTETLQNCEERISTVYCFLSFFALPFQAELDQTPSWI